MVLWSSFRKNKRKRAKFCILFSLLILGAIVSPWCWLRIYSNNHIASAENISEETSICIVLGAGLQRNGKPSAMLQDRIFVAVSLYKQNKVKKLLMTGDNRYINYNEPLAMKRAAIKMGVPPEAIVLDYAGRRTYDSCYRAKAIFGVSKAVIVTQQFHLPRAVYLARQMDIDAVGVPADTRSYGMSGIKSQVREVPACIQALLDLHIIKPLPVLGEPEPIASINQDNGERL